MLDALEAEHPERRVVRIRPGIVLQAAAASALARYFLGPFVPQSLVRRALLPVVPRVDRLEIQAVHAEDVARAFLLGRDDARDGRVQRRRRAGRSTPPSLGEALRAAPAAAARSRLVRAVVDLTWRLHLQPTDPGWVDLGRLTPLMDTTPGPRGARLDAAAHRDRRAGRDRRRDGPRRGRRHPGAAPRGRCPARRRGRRAPWSRARRGTG